MNHSLNSVFIALLFLMFSGLNAQVPGWDLARNGGNTQSDKGMSIHRHSPSIIYAGGHFSGSITFGQLNIPGSGGEDGLMIRFNAIGEAAWVNRIAGPGNERVLAVTSDASGNFYATGYFESTAGISGIFFESNGNKDLFIAKYSQGGVLSWVRNLGSVGDDMGTGVTCDALGNVYLSATYSDSLTFVTKTLDTLTYASAGGKDIILFKFDQQGKIISHARGGGSGDDISADILFHPAGLAFTGTFSGKAGFHNDTLTSNGASDILLANYSLNTFEPIWISHMGGTGIDAGDDLSIDNTGNLYLAGMTTGNFNVGQIALTSQGGTDGFLAKVTPAGVVEWARLIGGQGDDNCAGVSVDITGNVMTTGTFSGNATFDATTLTSRGGTDVYVLKLYTSGSIQWAQQAGSSSNDNVESISNNGSGSAYITGAHGFETTLTPFTLTGRGGDDFYMARILDIAQNDLAVIAVNVPAAPFAPGFRQISATIANTGSNTVTSATIELYSGNSKLSSKSLPGPLAPGATMNVSLDSLNLTPARLVELTAVAMTPNGQQDGNQGNNAFTRSIGPALLKGTYTIGGVSPSPTFTTVALATQYISNWGIMDSVVFHVRPGIYDGQIVMNEIPGSNVMKPVIFKRDPAQNQAPDITFTSQYAERHYVMQLNGTDNMHFDGLNFASKSGTLGNAISMTNTNTNITFNNVNIEIPAMASGNGISIDALNQTEGLKITNSMFIGGDYGIHSAYDTTLTPINSTLTGNQFKQFKQGGIHIRNTQAVSITGNNFEPGSSAIAGITLVKGSGNTTITNNVISHLRSGSAISVIEAPGNQQTTTMISNNMARVGDSTSNANGITLKNSGYASILHNTVHGANRSLDASLLSINGGSTITALNNLLTNPNRAIGISVSYTLAQSFPLVISDFNLIQTDSGRVGQINDGINTTQFVSLPQWRSATSKDINSLSKKVIFANDGLHLNEVDIQLFGDQTVKQIVNKDIDGDQRRNSYMGADEIIPVITVLQQPVRTITCDTITTLLFVTANATFKGQLTYQWTKNGTIINGATNDTLVINRATFQNEGFYRCIIRANSGADSVITNQAQLLVSTRTTILNDLQNQYTIQGGTAIFDIGAEVANLPPTHAVKYRWFRDTVEYTVNTNTVTGINTPRLVLRNIQVADTGARYSVIVEGGCGSDTSAIAGIYMPGVLFVRQPRDTASCLNGNVFVSAEVYPTISGLELAYQWKRATFIPVDENSTIKGATTSTLTIDSLSMRDTSSNYILEVIVLVNNARFFSNPVKIQLYKATEITKQPASEQVCMNKPYTFSVDAQGEQTTYQWQRNDTNIVGASDATYTVPLMSRDLIGQYRVIVTAICGTKASNIATITAFQELVVLSQSPKNVVINLTKNLSLDVYAAGVTPLRYQWYKNGEKIDGATEARYFKSNATSIDSGSYWCVINDQCGDINSDTIKVRLVPVSVEDEGTITGVATFGLQQIMPNPASDQVNARVMSIMPGDAMIEIHSILGTSMIPAFKITVDRGYTDIPINIEHLTPGTYLCTMNMNGKVSTQTFTIIR